MRFTIFVLSAAVIAHEVCLLRALAIAQFSHAASLVVSVALLGFGAAGTCLAIAPALRRPATVAACAALYAVLAPVALRVVGLVDFNVLEVGWDPSQWLRLLAWQGLLFVPFFLAALAIAVALSLWQHRAGAMYAVNLLGSGLGALAVAPLLEVSGPPERLVGGLALVAALGAAATSGRAAKLWALLGAGGALAWGGAFLLGGATLPMSPFKDLQAAPGRRLVATSYSPRGRVDRAQVAGLHHAPGLSLTSEATLPRQEALFVDGHQVGVVDLGPSGYLDDTVGALPLALLPTTSRVLLLGVGPDLPRATWVVEQSGRLLALAEARGARASPLGYLRDQEGTWDVVLLHVSHRDPILETPLLTVEGLQAALARVGEDGALAVSTHLTLPPRPGLKLLATAEAVTPHVLAVRSVDRLCVVLRRRATSPAEWGRVHAFCRHLGFDVVRPLALRPDDPHHRSATPLLRPPPDYPFDVRPATSARPYFHRYFRWARLGDLLDPQAVPFVQWGFVAVLAAFVQVVILAMLLLLGPLAASRAARAPAPLFLALGFAYMLLEMAFLSTAIVRTGSPTISAAAVIGGFLCGSGVGSLLGERLGRPLRGAALTAAVLALPLLLLLPHHPLAIGIVAAVVALPMGMPFPAALSRLPARSVPWALAVNGFASVAAAAGAPLLSSTFSITITAAVACGLYLLVALFGRRGTRDALAADAPGGEVS